MKRLTVKDLSVEEKLRLLCSKGFWYTMDFDGKLPSVSVAEWTAKRQLNKQSNNKESR